VLAAAILLLTLAGLLVAPVAATARSGGIPEDDDDTTSTWDDVVDGIRATREAPGALVLIGLLAAEDVVLGALDVLFVVVALSVLQRSQSWVGTLNGAYGLGGVLVGGAAFLLVGRRLPGPILGASVLVGLGLALVPLTDSTAITTALFVGVGAARAIMDVSTRTLLQRSVAPDVLGRVFGLVEGFTMLSVAAGSLLVPLLIAVGGPDAALIGVGCLLPAIAIISAPRLLRLDRESRIPVVEIALLRSIEMFARLPPAAIEGLARSLEPVVVEAGVRLIGEGETGEAYYAVADGRFAVSQADVVLGEVGRGAGIGEIALLRNIPRTATVTALCPGLVYRLPRELFLATITDHAATRQRAESTVARTLRRDAARSTGGSQT
jgi:hypothetical protein